MIIENIKAGYPRQVQSFLENMERSIEPNSREFEADIKDGETTYHIKCVEIKTRNGQQKSQ